MLSLILAALVVGTAEPPERCSVAPLRSNPEGYVWPLEEITTFATSADVIVRARADSMTSASEERRRYAVATDVHFTALEVVTGVPPAELKFAGELVDADDYNNGAVPYRMVRPSGQRGSCFTYEYRAGAEYLLILRNAPHAIPLIAGAETPRLNPYWAPLAPLNEQVRGDDDPWVQWVKARFRNQ